MISTCDRCKGVGEVEVHHYAPRAIFGKEDSETWGKGVLCLECHRLWHARIEAFMNVIVMERIDSLKKLYQHIPYRPLDPLREADARMDKLEPLSKSDH